MKQSPPPAYSLTPTVRDTCEAYSNIATCDEIIAHLQQNNPHIVIVRSYVNRYPAEATACSVVVFRLSDALIAAGNAQDWF